MEANVKVDFASSVLFFKTIVLVYLFIQKGQKEHYQLNE